MARQRRKKIIGPAVTLAFMPQREDLLDGPGQEQTEKRSALWSVFETVQSGDVLCIQAFGDPYTGCVREMLTTFLKGRGGAGIVVDGNVRDWTEIQDLALPVWTRGVTPNYGSQAKLFPWAVNVPIAMSMVTVIPGNAIIADDDGFVMVPRAMIPLLIVHSLEHKEWEVFSRMKLQESGDLRRYYLFPMKAGKSMKRGRQPNRFFRK